MTAALVRPSVQLPHFPDAYLLAPPGIPHHQWLRNRLDGFGGSDLAAAMGLDSRRGPLEVFAEKRPGYVQMRDPSKTRSARRGHRLEPLVAECLAEETGHLVLPTPGTLARKDEPWMRVNLDGMVFDPDPAVSEYKTRTWRSAAAEDWYGEIPPDGPTVQAYWGMWVTGWQRAYVAALIDDEFVWFRLDRDEELMRHIVAVARNFWYRHVAPGVPPPPDGLAQTKDLLTHLWQVTPGAVKVFDPDEVNGPLDRRRALKAQADELLRQAQAEENRLLMLLGDAEHAVSFDGTPLFSARQNGTPATKRLREDHPELAAKYTNLVEALDLEGLKNDHPDVYGTYRARVFRDNRRNPR